MKTRLFYLLLCLPFSSLAQKAHTGPRLMDLADAIREKMVAVVVESSGGHDGACMKIQCRSLKGQSMRLRIPQGQLMNPADTTMQVLVVAQEETVAVGAKTPAEAVLKAFCTQAGHRSPMMGTAFSTGAMAPDKVCQLLRFLSDHNKIDSGDAQSAVWCLIHHHHLGSIGDLDIRKFVADLTGLPMPGYHIQYETKVVPGQPVDWGKAMVIDSQFQYTLMEDDKLSLILYDANNKVVKVLRKDDPAKAGEHRSGLHLQVWTLDPGKYTVRLHKKDGTVIRELEVAF